MVDENPGYGVLIKKLFSLRGLVASAFALMLSVVPLMDSAAATANNVDATKAGKSPRVAKAAKPANSGKATKTS